jgi:two-component SAPR family response regulator
MNQWVENLRPTTRVIVLHPNAPRQHGYMWEPLSAEGALYVRLEGNDLTSADVLAQVSAAGQASSWLVLDESDRVQGAELASACLHLLEASPHLRVVLAGRVLPVQVLQHPALRQQVEFVPVDDASELYDYTRHDQDRPLLEVKSFGVGRVYLNGQQIDSWDGVLPRLLFFYFIDKGMVTRDEIFRTFWPNMSVKEATNVFHVTKRKVNEVLGLDLTVYQSGYYRVTDRVTLLYDVSQFNRTVQDTEVSDTFEVEPLLRDTIRLYQGDFLATSDADWVLRRRFEMRQAYGSALYAIGMLYESQGEKALAENFFLRAFRHNPHEPRYAEAVMHLLNAH